MKVSVLMPTYNHAATIAQAIDSFLLQTIADECELLISDDASTDSTARIAQEYARRFPDRIRVLVKACNEGLLANYRSVIEMANGTYYAILESDDYWTDSRKLEKQVAFLEAHPDYGLSFTRWQSCKKGVLEDAADVSDIVIAHQADLYDYMLLRSIIYSPTVVFRSDLYRQYCCLDDYIRQGFVTFDYQVWLSLAAHSRIHYLPEITAVYRISDTSLSNSGNLRKRLHFEKGIEKIRAYVAGLYGYGRVGKTAVRLRELLVRLRIVWRALF